MSNFKRDIVNAMELGESIEAIHVMEHMGFREEQARITEGVYEGQHVKRCLDLLDYEYDDGYGTANCHRVYIYTKTRVHFIHEYDGSTQVRSVPRHPKAVKVLMYERREANRRITFRSLLRPNSNEGATGRRNGRAGRRQVRDRRKG